MLPQVPSVLVDEDHKILLVEVCQCKMATLPDSTIEYIVAISNMKVILEAMTIEATVGCIKDWGRECIIDWKGGICLTTLIAGGGFATVMEEMEWNLERDLNLVVNELP